MKRILPFLLLVVLAGCTSFRPGDGFGGVQTDVARRIGTHITWDRGTDADARASAGVDALLARGLTADGAAQIALLNNRRLRAVYEDLDIAQADLVQAGLLKNPVFSGELRFSVAGGGTAIVLDVAQDFLSLLWIPLHKARAGAAYEAARLRVTAAVLAADYGARAVFYDYQAAEQTRGMRARVAEATDASYELAQRLRTAGNIRELDLLNERALHEQAALDLGGAEANAAQVRERLNVALGLWGAQAGWAPPERMAELPTEPEPVADLEAKAIGMSLELAMARSRVESAALLAGVSPAMAALDGATVGAAGERDGGGGGWSVGPSLSVPIPLFDTGQAAGLANTARLRQAQADYYAQTVEVRARARAAQATLGAARGRAERYHAVVLPLHQRIMEETQLQYNAMQVSAFQLLEAKRDQINAGAESIGALRDYWKARAAVTSIGAGGTGAMTEAQTFGEETMSTTSRHGGGHQ